MIERESPGEKKMRNYRIHCVYTRLDELDFSTEECRLASCQFSEIIAPEDRANLGPRQT